MAARRRARDGPTVCPHGLVRKYLLCQRVTASTSTCTATVITHLSFHDKITPSGELGIFFPLWMSPIYLVPTNPFQRNVLQATFAGPARLVTFTARDKNNSSNNDQFWSPAPTPPFLPPQMRPTLSIRPSECPVLSKEQTNKSAFICVTLSSRGCHASYPRALPPRSSRLRHNPPIFVKDVECAVLDPVPSLPKKLSVRILGSPP